MQLSLYLHHPAGVARNFSCGSETVLDLIIGPDAAPPSAGDGGGKFKFVPAGDKTFSKVQPGANLSERPPHSTVSESVDSSCCWIPAPRQRASNAAWTSKPAVLDDRLSTAQGKLASP